MVIHFCFDGDIILKDSDEAHDQEEYLDNKKRNNQALLDKINVAIKEEFGKDPCKSLFTLLNQLFYNNAKFWPSFFTLN